MATEPPQATSFRRLYLRPDSPIPDSPRLRRRLATIVPELWFTTFEERNELGGWMASAFGIDVDHYESMAGGVFEFEVFFLKADIHDLIESITAIARFFAIRQLGNANAWVALVRGLFAEEHMAYRIDDDGVVHPLVDQAFEAARTSVIGALTGDAFNAARAHFENPIAALEEQIVGKHDRPRAYTGAHQVHRRMRIRAGRCGRDETLTKHLPASARIRRSHHR
jgi:hypothetical protein